MAGNGRMRKLVKAYRIEDGRRFRSNTTTGRYERARFERSGPRSGSRRASSACGLLQEKLYGPGTVWAVLLIFQAMDAAGKDSVIKHVMSGINRRAARCSLSRRRTSDDSITTTSGARPAAFPSAGGSASSIAPTTRKRSSVRVHSEILARQRLPPKLVTRRIWQERHQDIAAHERYLARKRDPGAEVLPPVSKAEQKKRFLERLDRPEKHWKFSSADVQERQRWREYMAALRGHESARPPRRTPVVRRAGGQEVVHPPRGRGSQWPRPWRNSTSTSPSSTRAQKKELAAARRELEGERTKRRSGRQKKRAPKGDVPADAQTEDATSEGDTSDASTTRLTRGRRPRPPERRRATPRAVEWHPHRLRASLTTLLRHPHATAFGRRRPAYTAFAAWYGPYVDFPAVANRDRLLGQSLHCLASHRRDASVPLQRLSSPSGTTCSFGHHALADAVIGAYVANTLFGLLVVLAIMATLRSHQRRRPWGPVCGPFGPLAGRGFGHFFVGAPMRARSPSSRSACASSGLSW